MGGCQQGAIWPELAQTNKWDEIQLSDESTRGLVLLRPANAAALSAHPSNPSWGCAAARGVSCALGLCQPLLGFYHQAASALPDSLGHFSSERAHVLRLIAVTGK